METNVIKLKAPRKMGRKPKQPEKFSDNVVELPLISGMSPQELLAKLSRNPNITQVLVIFPEDHPDDEELQTTHVVSSNMTLADVNYFGDKAKLNSLGIET